MRLLNGFCVVVWFGMKWRIVFMYWVLVCWVVSNSVCVLCGLLWLNLRFCWWMNFVWCLIWLWLYRLKSWLMNCVLVIWWLLWFIWCNRLCVLVKRLCFFILGIWLNLGKLVRFLLIWKIYGLKVIFLDVLVKELCYEWLIYCFGVWLWFRGYLGVCC